MAFWMDLLFGNIFGAMSMFVIFFMLGMGGYFTWMFIVKSGDPDA